MNDPTLADLPAGWGSPPQPSSTFPTHPTLRHQLLALPTSRPRCLAVSPLRLCILRRGTDPNAALLDRRAPFPCAAFDYHDPIRGRSNGSLLYTPQIARAGLPLAASKTVRTYTFSLLPSHPSPRHCDPPCSDRGQVLCVCRRACATDKFLESAAWRKTLAHASLPACYSSLPFTSLRSCPLRCATCPPSATPCLTAFAPQCRRHFPRRLGRPSEATRRMRTQPCPTLSSTTFHIDVSIRCEDHGC